MALKMQMTPRMVTRASVEQASLKTKRRFVNRGCKLVGCGSAAPELQISNADLSKIVETSDEWIATRTGIRRRHILSGNESLKDLAVEAARNALEMAQVHPDEIDLVMLCTSTAEDQFGIAAQVQYALGCSNYPLSFDIRAGCSGFAIGLQSACSYVRGGDFRNALLIGAEAVSRILDWTDRGTCILFGDAAGAVVLQACEVDEDGLYAFDSHTDSEGGRHITTSITHDQTTSVSKALRSFAPGFPPGNPSYSYIQMNGKEVFRFAVQWVPQSLETALKKAGLRKPDIDWLLLHQSAYRIPLGHSSASLDPGVSSATFLSPKKGANQRIMDAVATRLEVPPERIISNIADYGNTSSASIPLALDEAVRSGKIKVGDVIATSGFGAGLTCASAIVRWG